MEMPTDLMPLPTMPYDERPDEIPLNVEECRTAIWRCKGNISDAAKIMKVSPSRFRTFVRNSPRLSREADEARELLLDKAESVALDALEDEDPVRKDMMARFVLDKLGHTRGYGQKGGMLGGLPGRAGKLIVEWGDGTSFNEGPVVEHE